MKGPVEMYKKMYYRLAGVLADAIEALEKGDQEAAKCILIEANRAAEDIYIFWEESEDGDLEAMKRIVAAECGFPEKIFMNRVPESFKQLMDEL